MTDASTPPSEEHDPGPLVLSWWPSRSVLPLPERGLAGLLDDVTRYIRRYVVLSDCQAVACTLWVAHCHAFAVAEATPYLNITSAVKQSGKTRLLEVLEPIVPVPWLTGRVSAAVLTRKVDAETPTLLLDESDAAFSHRSEYAEALRAMLNSGYRRSGISSLCVGQGAGFTYRDFSTFCPKAIAGIGALPETVRDRSIRIALKRRAPGERLARFRLRHAPRVGGPLWAQLDAWRVLACAALRDAEPETPSALGDRAADVWEPLLAIADMAGGGWPRRARGAATALSAQVSVDDDAVSIRLLQDIRQVFTDERLGSADLVHRLTRLEDRPWADWRSGCSISQARVATLLRPFGIYPTNVKGGAKLDHGGGVKLDHLAAGRSS